MNNCGNHRFTRRSFLLGAASAANFSLLTAHAGAQTGSGSARPRNTARTCIFINLDGGPSHLDTFDPKDGSWNPPDAALDQLAGGIVLSRRFFPNLSRIGSDLLVLRSVKSWEAAHERAQFYLQTGHPPNPAFAAEIPHMGAVIAREKRGNGPVPPFVALNAWQLQGSAMLGGNFAPFRPWPNRNGIDTLEHCCFGDQSQARFERRYALLQQLEAPLVREPFSEEAAAYGEYLRGARTMMYNPALAATFRFTVDDEQRYGNSNFGRALLLARNLVRAKNGAVFLSVNQGGWDTHLNMFDRGYTPNHYQLSNDLDRALANLVADLRASGDLASTLIVAMGEFGRTPGPLNARGGRDHHRDAMSMIMIGGGIAGGRAIGATDSTSASIVTPGWSADRPIYTEDIACTIYSALGVDWTKWIRDTPSGRLYQYVPGAADGQYQPVNEVFA